MFGTRVFPAADLGRLAAWVMNENVRARPPGGYGGKGGAPPFPQPCWRAPELIFGAVRQYAAERNGGHGVEWSGVVPVCKPILFVGVFW